MSSVTAQSRIQNLLDRLVSAGQERGLQVAVYCQGQQVVDAWAGIANHRTGSAVDGDTLFPAFSVTKGLMATVVHRLVARGVLSYDTPISEYWPEFAARGKKNITLRQGLSHTCGLPCMPLGMGYADLADWGRMCAAIADLAPLWPPGSRSEYHAVTYSWIVGEPARRSTGRSVTELVREEIAGPLGIEAMFLGIPDDVESRVALLEEYDAGVGSANDTQPQAIPGWMWPLSGMMNRPDMRRACVPATSGIVSARAIARHYAALLPGGVDGVELLSPERVQTATAWQELNKPATGYSGWFLGYAPSGKFEPGGSVAMFGHAGHGGATGFADRQRGLAVGVTKNLLSKNNTRDLIIQELDKAFAP